MPRALREQTDDFGKFHIISAASLPEMQPASSRASDRLYSRHGEHHLCEFTAELADGQGKMR
jgi:hypothetical protein